MTAPGQEHDAMPYESVSTAEPQPGREPLSVPVEAAPAVEQVDMSVGDGADLPRITAAVDGRDHPVTDYSSVYPAFVKGELQTERERRASLESRGGAVVTQSGALSTLLIAAAAFARGSGSDHLSNYAVINVIVSTGLFLGAGVLGILVSYPYLYKGQPVADDTTLDKMLTERRADPDATARTAVATLNKGTLGRIRAGNDKKVKLLSWAQIAQITGLAALLNGAIAAILG